MEGNIIKSEDELLNFDFPRAIPSIIKVMGVGGGGGNAVTHMYCEGGIRDVSFVLCNTDNQALLKSEVPVKMQLGKQTTEGLGAGGRPEIGRKAAEESIADLERLLSDGTKMVFVTAGMGGGTGTGAAPIVAGVAKKMNILTVGIVTIPFLFEGVKKIIQALKGVEEIRQNVDALLVINNERLRDVYFDLDIPNAFKKADDTLTIAAKSISEIITVAGIVNVDFADVNTTLRNGGVAIMSNGLGQGENRVLTAINNALHSPLLNNNDVFKAKKILLNITFGDVQPLKMEEMNEVHDFMGKFNPDIEVIWGTAFDPELEDQIKITILATGFGIEDVVPPIIEIGNGRKKILENSEVIRKAEEELQHTEEEEKWIRYLLKKYYGEDISIDRITNRPKPFIFNANNLDDNEIIEALITHPAYNRNPQLMLNIARKAEARRN
ncbi:MAG: cell division protein FtsZ [Dysgonamonadaceae bacterium]|jgi:cell division protein FtsZ|nr:cell division protein FtsZ [Dysgonamonadaceae bacterium]